MSKNKILNYITSYINICALILRGRFTKIKFMPHTFLLDFILIDIIFVQGSDIRVVSDDRIHGSRPSTQQHKLCGQPGTNNNTNKFLFMK